MLPFIDEWSGMRALAVMGAFQPSSHHDSPSLDGLSANRRDRAGPALFFTYSARVSGDPP